MFAFRQNPKKKRAKHVKSNEEPKEGEMKRQNNFLIQSEIVKSEILKDNIQDVDNKSEPENDNKGKTQSILELSRASIKNDDDEKLSSTSNSPRNNPLNNQSNRLVSIIDKNTDINDISQSKILRCPQCNQIPLINVVSKTKIHIKCKSCSHDKIYFIDSYLSSLSSENNQFVCLWESHEKTNNKPTSYCKKCKKWICDDCIAEHNNSKTTHTTLIKQNQFAQDKCNNHPSNKNSFYCDTCNILFCHSCLETHPQDHNYIVLSEQLTKEHFNNIYNQYKQAKETTFDYYLKLKNEIITELQSQIDKINTAYKHCLESNQLLSSYLEIIYSNYESYPLNYSAITNVLTNSSFEFHECTIDSDLPLLSLEAIDTIISFFNTKTYVSLHPVNCLSNFEIKRTLVNHESDCYINSLTVLQDGRFIASYSDNTLKIFNQHTFDCELTMHDVHKKGVTYTCQLYDGSLLTGSEDKLIKMWNIQGKKYELINTVKASKYGVCRIVSLSDDTRIFASFGFSSKMVKVWKWDENKNEFTNIEKFKGHTNNVESMLRVKKSDNNNLLLTGCNDKVLRFWELDTYQLIHSITNISFSSKNSIYEIPKHKVIVGGFNCITIINTDNYAIEHFLEDNGFAVIDCFALLNEDYLLIACGDGSGRNFVQFELDNFEFIAEKEHVHESNINSVVSIGNNTVASCSDDKLIIIWKF